MGFHSELPQLKKEQQETLTIPSRIRALDTTLFAAIHSESTEDDKQSLLRLQECVRTGGEYAYLEIGSYMGGSLQPYYADPFCTRVYSIDKRPDFMPDERGRLFSYPKSENSSQTMLDNLARAFPTVLASKVRTFDCDASELDPGQFEKRPRICFIDGEHTARAAYSDFQFCSKVADRDAIIAFHDADLVFNAIRKAEKYLESESVKFASVILPNRVYAILRNAAVDAYSARLQPFGKDREEYLRSVEEDLARMQEANRKSIIRKLRDFLSNYPWLYDLLRRTKGFLTR